MPLNGQFYVMFLFYHSKKKICSFRTGPHTPYKFHPPHSSDNLPDYQKPKGPLLQAAVSFTGRVGGLLWLVLSAEHCRLALAHADLFSSVWGTARHQERHLGAKHFTVSKPSAQVYKCQVGEQAHHESDPTCKASARRAGGEI